jgi:hypothetical protein
VAALDGLAVADVPLRSIVDVRRRLVAATAAFAHDRSEFVAVFKVELA